MVGRRIKEYIESRGIKQAFVAKQVGITTARLSEICNKGRNIDCETYYKICKTLDVPLETFLEGE